MIDLIITAGESSNVKDFIGPRGISFQAITPKRPEGRPTVMTPDTLRKLEEAFLYGLSDRKACIYADIGLQTLYDYQAKHPEFSERKEELKSRPDISAQIVLVKKIEDNLDQARWWANHRIDEFAPKNKVELSGDLTQRTGMTPEVAKVIEETNLKIREALAAPHKPV